MTMVKLEGLHEVGLFTESNNINFIYSKDNELDYPKHWHNALELVYVINGEHKIFVDQVQYILREKDILLVTPGDIHSVSPFVPDSEKIYIQFHSNLLESFYELGLNKSLIYKSHFLPYEHSQVDSLIGEQIAKLAESLSVEGHHSSLFVTARMCDLFSLLTEKIVNSIVNDDEDKNTKVHGLKKINTAFEFIEKNFENAISLKDVADHTGFNEAYFSRIFKEIYGKNFNIFLKEFRIKKCEHLLMNANTITEAALSSGFNSVTTFNRVFKEVKGCTPSEYLKMTLH